MKDNSNSSLKIKQLMFIIPMLIILTTVVQLFAVKQNKTQIAEINTVEETNISEQEEIQVATAETQRVETVTSRSNIERTLTEAQYTEYKSIDEVTISKDMDLTVSCGVSKSDFKEMISQVRADTSNFFYDNSDIIYDLCQEYELNELFFCGLIAGESGWGIAKSHRNANNYISMMSGGKLIRYSSVEEGLEAAAKLLHTKYLSKGGAYYSGKTLANVQKRFCPNSSTWVNLIYQAMKTIVG